MLIATLLFSFSLSYGDIIWWFLIHKNDNFFLVRQTKRCYTRKGPVKKGSLRVWRFDISILNWNTTSWRKRGWTWWNMCKLQFECHHSKGKIKSNLRQSVSIHRVPYSLDIAQNAKSTCKNASRTWSLINFSMVCMFFVCAPFVNPFFSFFWVD